MGRYFFIFKMNLFMIIRITSVATYTVIFVESGALFGNDFEAGEFMSSGKSSTFLVIYVHVCTCVFIYVRGIQLIYIYLFL